MGIKIGTTWFDVRPAPRDLPGYRSVLAADWGSLRMNFQKLSFWSCKTGTWDTALPARIALEQILCITAPTPMGRQNANLKNARIRRLLGKMQLKGPALDKVLNDAFPPAKFNVPVQAIRRLQSETASYLVGFYRMDDHILLVPEGRNPTGDFMILSLPHQVRFFAFQTDTCPSTPLPDSAFENELFSVETVGGPFGGTMLGRREYVEYHTPPKGSDWANILSGRFSTFRDKISDKDDYADYFRRFSQPERRALAKKYHGT